MSQYAWGPAHLPPIELHYLGHVWRIGSEAAIADDRTIGAKPPHLPVSSTAIGTALMRAVHSRLDEHPLIDDVLGERLIPEDGHAAYLHLAVTKLQSEGRNTPTPQAALDAMLREGSGFTNVIVRARFTEDALRNAIDRGITQYVIVGAGFDSFALRGPAFAAGVDIIEIDHPTTQAVKRQRIEQCALRVPPSLHFIAADLATDDLAMILAGSPFRSDRPGFFSWLGVTMFLTREENLKTLRAIASCSAPGSEIVFTYLDNRIFRSPSERFRKMRDSVQSVGEPFRSGFDPRCLAEDLRQVGLELIQDFTEAQLLERYSRQGGHSMVPLEYSQIALARVP